MKGIRATMIILIVCFSTITHAKDLVLQYDRAARQRTEALLIGNSRLGAMVYGGTGKGVLQLNEETFWSGDLYSNNNTERLGALPGIRDAVFKNDSGKAQKLIDRCFTTGQHEMRYLTLGSLYIDFGNLEDVEDYKRELDLNTATASVRYMSGDVDYILNIKAPVIDDGNNQQFDLPIVYECDLVTRMGNEYKVVSQSL